MNLLIYGVLAAILWLASFSFYLSVELIYILGFKNKEKNYKNCVKGKIGKIVKVENNKYYISTVEYEVNKKIYRRIINFLNENWYKEGEEVVIYYSLKHPKNFYIEGDTYTVEASKKNDLYLLSIPSNYVCIFYFSLFYGQISMGFDRNF